MEVNRLECITEAEKQYSKDGFLTVSVEYISGLPGNVRGAVSIWNSTFHVFISKACSADQQRESLRHEMFHILNGDLFSTEDVSTVEWRAHRLEKR